MLLQRIREWLSLVLIALLPFHAFLVTVLTKWIEGPGHAPMTQIALWKEMVLGVILLIAIIEIAIRFQISDFRKKLDVIDGLIIGLLLISAAVSFSNSVSIISVIYGIRYDFVPIIAFLILRRVSWSDAFLKRVMNVILCSGLIIALYGLISFFLPASFFIWLGYSDLHSLYVPDGPLAPFQQIGGTTIRRIQSVMSGPNQLGLWLLLPLAVASCELRVASRIRISNLLVLVTVAVALLLTFSRAAWIGAAVIVGISVWPAIRSLSRRTVLCLLTSGVSLLVLVLVLFPSVFLRTASSRGHIENPIKAVQMMVAYPFGLGLGTAGPASNRTSDACVMLEAGSDASWAKDRPDLCVFVADAQVQPVDRTCNCSFLPENWYLQIGVEMGWVGLGLYLALVIIVLRRLRDSRYQISDISFSIFLALSIAALFLHAWEDGAVAYTVWMLIAAVI